MSAAELDYNNIININADGDRSTSLKVGVWQGNASISVWANSSQVVRFSTPRTFQVLLREALEKLLVGKPGEKYPFTFNKWDQDTKKSVPLGSLQVGRDDKAMFYFGVQTTGHPPMKFVLKAPISFDTADPMSDVQRSELAAKTVVEQLKTDIALAIANTSVKRQPPGGGARGGGHGGGGDIF